MRTAHNYCPKFEAALTAGQAKTENQGGGKGNTQKIGCILVSRLRPRQVRYPKADWLRPQICAVAAGRHRDLLSKTGRSARVTTTDPVAHPQVYFGA
jgi:hypothetical protein